MDFIDITAAHGTRFRVIHYRAGDPRPPAGGAEITRASVAFYDLAGGEKFGPNGQYVSSYYVRGVGGLMDDVDPASGLDLSGGVPNWRVDAVTMRLVRAWLNGGRWVYFTGDVRTPDGSDTSIHGDPTEEGHGESLETGWIDPDWSLSTVHDKHTDVRPDIFDPADFDPADESRDPAVWLVSVLDNRLNGIERQPGGTGTIYSADHIDVNHYTGVTVHLAAHPEGFTEDEITRAWAIILASK
jgi:hypothetical protein